MGICRACADIIADEMDEVKDASMPSAPAGDRISPFPCDFLDSLGVAWYSRCSSRGGRGDQRRDAMFLPGSNG
ncbi:hypothetical protein AMJ82_04005 [candidate division TA06 bacterium SM23_40]|uniref:Uncharacterized protein n=1 Tax=candidate division TA06 bacterium SM23_40 TaxID=1703774 RepID=A0A0S8GCT4_UNCT6|nr:MAG: hypothetical protein AMJ82_04005 [candidate division TA06 bacterium SM23_40]